jgi:hypothetical protein
MSGSQETVRPKSPADGYGSTSSAYPSDGSRRTSDEEKAVGAEASAPASAPKPAGGEPPDGGWEAWSVVVGVWCISFCSFGWVNSEFLFVFHSLRGWCPCTAANRLLAVRHRHIPGVLRQRALSGVLDQHHILDHIAADLYAVVPGTPRRLSRAHATEGNFVY